MPRQVLMHQGVPQKWQKKKDNSSDAIFLSSYTNVVLNNILPRWGGRGGRERCENGFYIMETREQKSQFLRGEATKTILGNRKI